MGTDNQDAFSLFVKIPDNIEPSMPCFFINSTPSGSVLQLIAATRYIF
jgi:hypothetical protein